MIYIFCYVLFFILFSAISWFASFDVQELKDTLYVPICSVCMIIVVTLYTVVIIGAIKDYYAIEDAIDSHYQISIDGEFVSSSSYDAVYLQEHYDVYIDNENHVIMCD